MDLRIALFVLVLIGTIESASKKRTKLGEKEETKNREKSDKKDEEEENTEDINDLPLNATLTCYECLSSSCLDKDKTSFTKTKCEPNEICWKSHVSGGYLRGCGSRQCIPRVFTTFEANTTKFTTVANMCCIRDLCNSSFQINSNLKLISFFLLVLIVF